MSENVREPQVLDTIGKGGDYWRITDIDEKGSITAWRIYDGKIYKKGRPLRINVEKIKDGTYRLLDIPPVTVTHVEPKARGPIEEPIEDNRTREDMQDEINYLRINLIKAGKENETLQEELRSVNNDLNILKDQLENAEQEKNKREGYITGLMTAMNLLIHGQGAKG